MRVAIIGSRNIEIDDVGIYIPVECTEIVSGGAKGVDMCAAKFARDNKIKLTEFLPCYEVYGKGAPIVRNKQIVDYADIVIAFWDGKSKGTDFVIKHCKKVGKKCNVIIIL